MSGSSVWNNVVIRYNNSTTNTWAIELNGVTIIKNSNSNHEWWRTNSGVNWGIGAWNINGSNQMNTFVKNVSISYN